MTVAKMIRDARVKRGLSQKEAAEQVGISQQAFASWETGRTNPRKGNVRALAATLKIAQKPLLNAANRL